MALNSDWQAVRNVRHASCSSAVSHRVSSVASCADSCVISGLGTIPAYPTIVERLTNLVERDSY